MPQPAIQSPVLAQLLALPATTAANSVTLPVRVGFRPYTERTRGKRPANLVLSRGLAAATAPGTAAPIGVFGCEWKDSAPGFGVDANGRTIAGTDPGTAPLNLAGATPGGAFAERIKVSGGAGAGIGPIMITNPGSGYTSAPTITFANAGAAAATALISADGRVVGALITNIGTWASNSTISIAAPTVGQTATAAITQGKNVTVNTHIPYAVAAPTTAGGAMWFAVWRDRIIPLHTGLLAPTANAGLDPDQQVQGLAANYGFTLATGTHPDGTTTIGVLTLGAGIPDGDTILVVRAPVRQLLAPFTTNGFLRSQIKTLDVMWLGGNATAGATETSVIGCTLEVTSNC